VHRKWQELWPKGWILHHNNAPAQKVLSVEQFVAQKSIIGMEHPPCSPDLPPCAFRLFQKTKFALKGLRFQDNEDLQKKSDDTDSYSTTGAPEMFQTVAASLG
jgi:hypothetical protein